MDTAVHSDWSAPPADPHGFERSVARLVESIRTERRISHLGASPLPHRSVILDITNKLTELLFPGYFGKRDLGDDDVHAYVGAMLRSIEATLTAQIDAALAEAAQHPARDAARDDDEGVSPSIDDAARRMRAQQTVAHLLQRLPGLREILSLDVQAAYDGDPAAGSASEIIFCYPGLRALTVHRLAHELYRLHVPLVPRIMAEAAHAATGIDIHPGARIGRSFFIDHGTGVVIGETAVIGDHCRVYQSVTLGARSFPKDERGRLKRGEKRHPTLEDHVIIYAGATVLGGDTVIGAGSVINGGVFLTHSVPPGHIVRGPKAELKMRNNPELPPPMYAI